MINARNKLNPAARTLGFSVMLLNEYTDLHSKPDCDILLVKNKGHLRWVVPTFLLSEKIIGLEVSFRDEK